MSWKVSIHRKPGYWMDEIYVFRKENTAHGEFIEFMHPGNGANLVTRMPYQEGMTTDKTPAFLRMDPREMNDFLAAFRDALTAFNIPGNDHMRLTGELDATRKHLSDMQKLVFEKRIK